MKRLLIIFIFVGVLFCSCNKANIQIEGNQDPPAIASSDIGIYAMLGIEAESDYRNISAHTEYDEYKLESDTITCTITNSNPGKGFYFFEFIYLEKKIGDSWVRLKNTDESIEYAQYAFCATPNAPEKCFSVDLTLDCSNIEQELREGKYRIVIFTAQNPVYAYFEIVR